MTHPTWIEIDLNQFRKNVQTVRSMIGTSRFCLPVKANAYGHGLIGIGKAAQEAGLDCLGVSCLQEGIQLRLSEVTIPILVFGAIHEDQIRELIQYDLEFSISSKFKAGLVSEKSSGKCRVHLEVETGMQRTGVRPDTAIELATHLKTSPCFDFTGVYSHLATADRPGDCFAYQQIKTFRELLQHPVFRGVTAHIANSGGVIYYPDSHFDMVRPGLMVYGYSARRIEGIAPCFSLKSRVSYFKVVEKGSGISYGHQYRTKNRTRIITIPIGYGDGYKRSLSNRGSVLIRGKRFPIVGAICMDQLMVDIGEEEVYVGDEVILIGRQENEEIKLTEIACICDTIPYEILSSFNQRIPRIFKQ